MHNINVLLEEIQKYLEDEYLYSCNLIQNPGIEDTERDAIFNTGYLNACFRIQGDIQNIIGKYRDSVSSSK